MRCAAPHTLLRLEGPERGGCRFTDDGDLSALRYNDWKVIRTCSLPASGFHKGALSRCQGRYQRNKVQAPAFREVSPPRVAPALEIDATTNSLHYIPTSLQLGHTKICKPIRAGVLSLLEIY